MSNTLPVRRRAAWIPMTLSVSDTISRVRIPTRRQGRRITPAKVEMMIAATRSTSPAISLTIPIKTELIMQPTALITSQATQTMFFTQAHATQTMFWTHCHAMHTICDTHSHATQTMFETQTHARQNQLHGAQSQQRL